LGAAFIAEAVSHAKDLAILARFMSNIMRDSAN
jgi:hypothetical protein